MTFADTQIARARRAAVRLPDVTRGGIARSDLSRVVGRTVVNDDDFMLGMRLRQHALDRFGQETSLLVTGDDDGHEAVRPIHFYLAFEQRQISPARRWPIRSPRNTALDIDTAHARDS